MSLYPNWLVIEGRRYQPETPIPSRRLWRVLHDAEIGKIWRAGLPEVHPLYANHHSPFQKWAQLVSHQINQLAPDVWTKFYHYRYAFTNDNGFGDPAVLR